MEFLILVAVLFYIAREVRKDGVVWPDLPPKGEDGPIPPNAPKPDTVGSGTGTEIAGSGTGKD